MLFGVPDSDLKPIRSRSDTQKKKSALDGFESRFLTYIYIGLQSRDFHCERVDASPYKEGMGCDTHAITRISYNPPI